MTYVTIPREGLDYVYGPYPTPEDAAIVEARLLERLAWEDGTPSFSWGGRQDLDPRPNNHMTFGVRERRAGQRELGL